MGSHIGATMLLTHRLGALLVLVLLLVLVVPAIDHDDWNRDTDGDGLRDHIEDLDDDNDGILDVNDEDDDGDGVLDRDDEDWYQHDEMYPILWLKNCLKYKQMRRYSFY